MAAASRAALAVSYTASLAPENGNVEARTSFPMAVSTAGKTSQSTQWSLQAVAPRTSVAPGSSRPRSISCAANANDVAVTTAPAPIDAPKAEVPPLTTEPDSKPEHPIQETSAFISDVANLVKLVDSRDIVELELKHKKIEIIIRKKEALKKDGHSQSLPGPHVMGHTPWPQYAPPPPPAAAAPPPAAAVAPPPVVEEPAPAPPAPVAPTGPAFKSPMAGTFYRSPAPGEPAFVKVGDKVSKGQVVGIIEAMKLMNEIEADMSGTITDIVAKDGGPVAIDTPLFIITP